MKKLQQLSLAGVFTLMLATATFGGDIATGGKTPPPLPASTSATASGEIPRDDAGYEYQLIEDITLELLRAMLSVF